MVELSSRKVLTVDDDSLICWALHKKLTTQGMKAFIAGTGRERD